MLDAPLRPADSDAGWPTREQTLQRLGQTPLLTLRQELKQFAPDGNTPDAFEYDSRKRALDARANFLIADAIKQEGPENLLRWMAENINNGEFDAEFARSVLGNVYMKKAREPLPSWGPQEAVEFVKGAPLVFKDLVDAGVGLARYFPDAASGAFARSFGGMATEEQLQAMNLMVHAMDQGTSEALRLMQRLWRWTAAKGSRGEGFGGVSDDQLRDRLDWDLSFHTRLNLVERGQRPVEILSEAEYNRRVDDLRAEREAQGIAKGNERYLDYEDYVRLRTLPEMTQAQIDLIQPIGEVFDLTNFVPGIGGARLASKAFTTMTKKYGKTAAKAAAAPTAAGTLATPVTGRVAAEGYASLPRRAAGKTVEGVGWLAEKTAGSPVLRAVAAGGGAALAGVEPVTAVLSALLGVSSGVTRSARQVAKTSRKTGQAIARPIQGPLATFERGMAGVLGASAAGVGAMAPLSLAGETAEERGVLLAGGAVFGGAGGTAGVGISAARSGLSTFGRSYWTGESGKGATTKLPTTTYGTEYDALHAAAVADLTPEAHNRIEAIRTMVDAFSTPEMELQLYVLEDADFDALGIGGVERAQGVVRDGDTAFVRKSGSALAHEPGHLIINALPPAVRAELEQAVAAAYTPDQLAAMQAGHETAMGIKLDARRAVDEVLAEHFSAAFRGVPLRLMGTPRSLAERIYAALGSAAESAGLRDMNPGQRLRTSEALPFTPSFFVLEALENVITARMLDTLPEGATIEQVLSGEVSLRPEPLPLPERPARPRTPRETPPTPRGAYRPFPIPRSLLLDPSDPNLPEGITGEADVNQAGLEYLQRVEEGKTPRRLLRTHRRMAAENDIRLSAEDTPATLADKLREKRYRSGAIPRPEGAPTSPTPASAPAPVPAARPAPARPTPREEQRQPAARPTGGIYAEDRARQRLAGDEASPEVQAQTAEAIRQNLATPPAQRPPMQAPYNSALADEAKGTVGLTEPQRAEQRRLADEGARQGRSEAFRALYDKVMVPIRLAAGDKNVYAFSLDKVIRNIEMLSQWFAENPDAGRRILAQAGYTSLNDPKFIANFKAYLENQANGYAGDGRTIVRPADTDASLVPAQTPGYVPTRLQPGAAGLINSLMGVRNVTDWGSGASLEKTYIARLAQASGVPVVEQRVELGAGGRQLRPKLEFNTTNADLRQAGFDTNLFHVAIENLRLSRFGAPPAARPDLTVRAPSTAFIQAGFMPSDPAAREAQRAASYLGWRAPTTEARPTPAAQFMPAERLRSQVDRTLSRIPPKVTRQQIDAALRDGLRERGQLLERPVRKEELQDIKDETGLTLADFLRDNPTADLEAIKEFVEAGQTDLQTLRLQGEEGWLFDGEQFDTERGAERARERALEQAYEAYRDREYEYYQATVEGDTVVFQDNTEVLYEIEAKEDGTAEIWNRERGRLEDTFDSIDEARDALERYAEQFNRDEVYRYVDDSMGDGHYAENVPDVEHRETSTEDSAGETKYSDYTLQPGSDSYREVILTVEGPGYAEDYVSSHFEDVSGKYLSHYRADDNFQTADGKRVFVVEEIQSDRHQEGRKEGYAVRLTPERRAELETQAEELRQEEIRLRKTARDLFQSHHRWGRQVVESMSRYVAQAQSDNPHATWLRQNFDLRSEEGRANTIYHLRRIHRNRWADLDAALEDMGVSVAEAYRLAEEVEVADKKAEAVDQEYRTLSRVIQDGRDPAGGRTPDTPFKKSWHELTFKTALLDAIDSQADVFAWTPGDIQAKRYSNALQKAVREVVATAFENGKYSVDFYGPGNSPIHSRESATATEIADLVGKEGAKQIIDAAQRAAGRPATIPGNNLKVGGEGMRAFYDRILVNFANDYLKPFGVKVGDVQVVKEQRPDLREEFRLRVLPPKTTLHGFEIPPALKARAMSDGLVRYMPTERPEVIKQVNDGSLFGATFRLDGIVDTDPHIVVTFQSQNVPRGKLTEQAIDQFVGALPESVRNNPDTRVGVFNLETVPETSIDLNVALPQDAAERAAIFARANGQESIWDGYNSALIRTGGDGKALLNPSEIPEALDYLQGRTDVLPPSLQGREFEIVAEPSPLGDVEALGPAEAAFMPAEPLKTQFKSRRKKGSLGGTQQLVHFSSVPLTVLDPQESSGRGAATPTDLRGLPRGYFYRLGEGAYEEAITSRQNIYLAQVDGNAIYNLAEDPLGYAAVPNRERADQMLRDAGFVGMHGISSGVDMVAMFEPVQLTEATREEARIPERAEPEALAPMRPLEAEELPDYDAWFEQMKSREVAPRRRRGGASPQFMPAPSIESAEFKRWFGDWTDPAAWTSRAKEPVSMVVTRDDDGVRPQVVYHGTHTDFNEFRSSGTGVVDYGFLGTFDTPRTGIFFTPDAEAASGFAEGVGGQVIPAYLDIKSPANLTTPDATYDTLEEVGMRGRRALQGGFQTWELFDGEGGAEFVAALKEAGYDGARFSEYVPSIDRSVEVFVAFEPTQVKSAIGNVGRYSTRNPDIRFMPGVAQSENFTLTSEVVAQFMPAPTVDLADYVGRDVIALTTDRLDVGEKWVGPRGQQRPIDRPAQGGRGFPLVHDGLGWAFSTVGTAKQFLTRLKNTTNEDGTAIVATSILGERNVLNSPFGQLAIATAYRQAVESGALKERAVDRTVREVFSRAAARTGGDKNLAKIRTLSDYEKAVTAWPFSFADTRAVVTRMDATKLSVPLEIREALGLDTLSIARSISDPALSGLPDFAIVSLMEIPLAQSPVRNEVHFSYPFSVEGKFLGFLSQPYLADQLISSRRVRNKQDRLTAQPMMTVMPSLDRLMPSDINPDPEARLSEARLDYAP